MLFNPLCSPCLLCVLCVIDQYARHARLSMKHLASFTLSICLALLFSTNGSAQQATPKAAQTKTPEVKSIDVAALKKLLERDEKRARPLLVNFWATWCDPCREEFPDLVAINNQYQQHGLEFITVSLDELSEIKTTVPKFLGEMKADHIPAYLLATSDTEAAIEAVDPQWAGGLPATFLIDSSGRIVFKYMGRVKPQELRVAIEKLIGDRLSDGRK
jgi:thiol-disulfide isomerase/thioredoxin